jgi:hypothetical protein
MKPEYILYALASTAFTACAGFGSPQAAIFVGGVFLLLGAVAISIKRSF